MSHASMTTRLSTTSWVRDPEGAAGSVPLGPSAYGHRSLTEELLGVVQERATRGSKMPRPGVGTRAATDPRVVTSPAAFISPRTLLSPRTFVDPRGTTAMRAITHR